MKRRILDWVRRGAACGLLVLAGSGEAWRPRCGVVEEAVPVSTDPLDWSPDGVAPGGRSAPAAALDAEALDAFLEAACASRAVERAAASGALEPREAAARLLAVWAGHGLDRETYRALERRAFAGLTRLALGERPDAPELRLVASRREALEALLW